MAEIHITRRSSYSAAQMHALVLDIDNYHKFIPFCTASCIVEKKEEGSTQKITADLSVAYKFLRETYRSEITAGEDIIQVRQSKGPFRHLNNEWRFTSQDEGSLIDFRLEFEFAVPLLSKLLKPIMPLIIDRFVTSFENRARDIYN